MNTPASSPRRDLVVWIGFPLALLAGFAAGRWTNPRQTTDAGFPGGTALTAPEKDGSPPSARAGPPNSSASKAMRDRIRNATSDRFPALAKEIAALPEGYARQSALLLLWQRWVVEDAPGCDAFASSEQPDQRAVIMGMWVRQDTAGAFAAIQAEKDPAKLTASARLFFAQLANVDAAKFIALAAAAKEDQVPSAACQDAFRRLASADPASALEVLASAGPKIRGNAVWAIGTAWAEKDPAAALAWARGLSDPVEKQSALRGVLSAWARSDADAAFAEFGLLEKVSGAKGDDPKLALIRSLTQKDPRQAFDFVVKNITKPQERNGLLASTVLPQLGLTLPPAEFAKLLDEAKLLKDVKTSSMTMNNFLTMRVTGFDASLTEHGMLAQIPPQADPAAALKSLEAGGVTAASKYVAGELAGQWVAKDPAAALAAWQADGGGPFGAQLRDALLSRVHSHADFNLLSALSTELQSGDPTMLEETTFHTAWAEPAKTLEWADSRPADDKLAARLRGYAVADRAAYDLSGSLEYAAARPPEEQPALYNKISAAWAQSDTYASSEWLDSLPPGPNRDQAALGLIDKLREMDPDSSLQWSLAIGDESLRDKAVTDTLVKWAQRSPADAGQALENSSLAPALKSTIAERLKTPFAR